SSSNPQDFLAAMGSDLNFDGLGNPGTCWRWTSPTNDTCVISWVNVPFWQSAAPTYSGSNSFQIILNKNDSSITFQYYQQQGIYTAAGNFMTIGIENITGTVGLQVLYSPPNLGGYYITTPYAIKFYYPPSTTYVATDVEAHWNNNTTSGGLFLSRSTPTLYQMVTAVKNTGNVPVSPFGVNCKIVNSSNIIVAQDNAVSNALSPSQIQVLTMNNTWNPIVSGTYKFITTTSLAGDIVITNNVDTQELVVVDTTQLNIRLSYDDNAVNGVGLSWNGGNGGAGMQFVPPFLPCKVKQLHFYIVSNPLTVGFYAKLLSSGGPNGLPLVVLDSIYVPAASVIPGAWNNVVLPAPIQIDTGSFFVSWNMDGDGITLGQDTNNPVSNRTFEVLANTWAIYRYRQNEDLMINATIERVPSTVDVNQLRQVEIVGDFYPNPADKNSLLELNVNPVARISITLYSPDGKRVFENKISSGHAARLVIPIDVSKLAEGIYFCRIRSGDIETTKKITVAH
ncbi:MAG: T9SS type A sorting domain-containing protein, partial [Bacteroidia bacterium]|nr:T9SS type A sorting domain-containing protein [Bacteroidia bacterium]